MHGKGLRIAVFTVLAALAFLLTACSDIDEEELYGGWSGESGRVHFNADGTYELERLGEEAGLVVSESGRYELKGGKIAFYRRDKYSLNDRGEVQYERLIKTEDRKEKASVSGNELKLEDITYTKQEE